MSRGFDKCNLCVVILNVSAQVSVKKFSSSCSWLFPIPQVMDIAVNSARLNQMHLERNMAVSSNQRYPSFKKTLLKNYIVAPCSYNYSHIWYVLIFGQRSFKCFTPPSTGYISAVQILIVLYVHTFQIYRVIIIFVYCNNVHTFQISRVIIIFVYKCKKFFLANALFLCHLIPFLHMHIIVS